MSAPNLPLFSIDYGYLMNHRVYLKTLTTRLSASLVRQNAVERGSPHVGRKASPNRGRKASTLKGAGFFTTLAFVWMTSMGAIAQAQSAANAPATRIQFADVTYHLVWRSDPTPDYSKFEYLPQDQELPTYHNMLLLEWLFNGMTVEDVVSHQVDFLRERAQTDPVVQHRLIKNESTGEYLLDFVLSGEDDAGDMIVEWNAYRYIPHQSADGRAGVLLYGYSARGYGDEGGRAFLIDLRKSRIPTMQALISASVP